MKIIEYGSNKRVRDLVTCPKLFQSDKTLSRGSESGCHKPNKNIRIPVGGAYFIPRPLQDVT